MTLKSDSNESSKFSLSILEGSSALVEALFGRASLSATLEDSHVSLLEFHNKKLIIRGRCSSNKVLRARLVALSDFREDCGEALVEAGVEVSKRNLGGSCHNASELSFKLLKTLINFFNTFIGFIDNVKDDSASLYAFFLSI